MGWKKGTVLRLLDEHHPAWDVRSIHERIVMASPERTFEAVRRLDLSSSAVVRILFRLRGLPRSALNLDGLRMLGFTVLGEAPPQELALGVIGRFWTLRGDLQRFAPDEYRHFSERGFAKAAWGFDITADRPGTRVRTETRISGTDPASRRRFQRYWRVVGPFSAIIRTEALRTIARDAES